MVEAEVEGALVSLEAVEVQKPLQQAVASSLPD